jgi:histidinol-phosphate aminotransferase
VGKHGRERDRCGPPRGGIYAPGKRIEELEGELGSRCVIKLASNENPFGPSPKAVAAVSAVIAGMHRYPDSAASSLTQALAKQHRVEPERILVANGSIELIELALRAFVRPGDEAVMARQTFPMYRLMTEAAGGRAVTVDLRESMHDLPAMAAAVTAKTRVVFVANPNNPTGTVILRAEWTAFVSALRDRRVLLIADGAYAEFVDHPEFPRSMAECDVPSARVVNLRTFSKLYGLAGLRVGYAIGPPQVIEAMGRLRQPFSVSLLAQVGALAALDDHDHVQRTLDNNRTGLRAISAGALALGMTVVPSCASFVMVRVGEARAVYEQLLKRGVIVRQSEPYGFPEYLRLSIGLPGENDRLLSALGAVL